MAHTCPVCWQLCHCKGDIDDICFDREPKGGCIHYLSDGCDGDDEDDEDSWDDEDYDDPDSIAEDNNPNDSRNL